MNSRVYLFRDLVVKFQSFVSFYNTLLWFRFNCVFFVVLNSNIARDKLKDPPCIDISQLKENMSLPRNRVIWDKDFSPSIFFKRVNIFAAKQREKRREILKPFFSNQATWRATSMI